MDDLILAEGKTKRIINWHSNMVRVRNLPRLTWDDKYNVHLEGKDISATTTTCNVFQMLVENDIPVAFEGQQSETDFLAPYCRMVPVEEILRFSNEPESSYAKRNPDEPLGPFKVPKVEHFLKTSGKSFGSQKLDFDDPYIVRYDNVGMWVHDPKLPIDENKLIFVHYGNTFPGVPTRTFDLMEDILIAAGNTMRDQWKRLGWTLGDFKAEFGFATGELLLADVLDNDSWRIQDPDGVERSKQTVRTRFKKGGEAALSDILAEAAHNYGMVAEASEGLVRA